jgi:hypothetical protein
VHVLVTTYGEGAEMVRECLIRLLTAPEPIDMEKSIYVCDDGHAKPEGAKKRTVVEELRTLGVPPAPLCLPGPCLTLPRRLGLVVQWPQLGACDVFCALCPSKVPLSALLCTMRASQNPKCIATSFECAARMGMARKHAVCEAYLHSILREFDGHIHGHGHR